ncbi:MAG: hypothetical protein AAGG53_10960 [Cyanobacteria bacterium P01_H01_bin.152]
MQNPQSSDEGSGPNFPTHQRLGHKFQTIRRQTVWIWLLLVFGWYALHGSIMIPADPARPELEIDGARVVQAVFCMALWSMTWAATWIWVWPVAIFIALAAACLLSFLSAIVVVLGHAPPDMMNSLMRSAITFIVIWLVVMNVLGAGAALSLKKRYSPKRAFQILLGTALSGLTAGLVFAAARYLIITSV